MKVKFNIPNKKPVWHFFETDSVAHTIKDYSFSEKEKKLTGLQEFNNNWLSLSSTSYNSEGKATHLSVYEYDQVNHSRKRFFCKRRNKKTAVRKKI